MPFCQLFKCFASPQCAPRDHSPGLGVCASLDQNFAALISEEGANAPARSRNWYVATPAGAKVF